MVKCDGWHFQFAKNAAIHLRFLVRVGFNSGYNISYTLPDKLSYRLDVFVDIVLGSYDGYVCMFDIYVCVTP